MAVDEDTRTGHPVPDEVRALRGRVGELVARPLFALDPAATRETLVELTRLTAQLDALTLAVAAHAEAVDVAAESGAASTAAWWARATRETRPSRAGRVRLALSLEQRWGCLSAAFAAGETTLDQARSIAHALDELPDTLDAEVVQRAERHLVELAAEHDAVALRRLGRAILEVVAPEVADRHEQERLDAELRRAMEKTRLTMSRDGHGAVNGRFTLPEAQAAMFEKALWALASPRHRAAVEKGEGPAAARGRLDRPTPQRLGEAFGELLEAMDRRDLPRTGGTDATVVVMTSLDDLRTGNGVAQLDTGEMASISYARRLACTGRIVPAVLGGKGEILDLGRSRRLFSWAQRITLCLRDRGCTAEGCDRPPAMCDAHHDTPWSLGGPTDLDHGRLLCPHHHRRVHDPAYETTRLPDNKLRFFHRRV